MAGSKNDVRDKALAVTRKTILEGRDYAALLAGAVEILRPHADTPAKQRALDRLAISDLRVDDLPAMDELEDADGLTRGERRIVERARRASRIGPIAAPEPPPDPQLEQLILECTARKVQAEAIAEARLDALIAIQVQLRKAQTPADIAKLQAKGITAADERNEAVHAVERVLGQLSRLLQQRANRQRMLLLAESAR